MSDAPRPAPDIKRRVYLVAFGLALLAAGIALLFFLIGVVDGTVSAFNAVLWLALLAVVRGIPWAGHALWSRGKTMQAIGLLAVAAVPMLLAGVAVVILIVAPPRWNWPRGQCQPSRCKASALVCCRHAMLVQYDHID